MKILRRLKYGRLLRQKHPARYANLFRTIVDRRCRHIVEIGTWNGVHAEQMISTAAIHADVAEVSYRGFDLFEELTEEQYKAEFSKRPPSSAEVQARLEKTGADVRLVKGNTRVTLPKHADELRRADLVFIDGGHSIETITADWNAVRQAVGPKTTVLFDDYYVNQASAVEGLGCQSIIDALDRSRYEVEVLDPVDEFPKPWGTLKVRMARVRAR